MNLTDLPAELLYKFADRDAKLFGRLSQVCHILSKIFREYLAQFLEETRCDVDPRGALETYSGIYKTIRVDNQDIMALTFTYDKLPYHVAIPIQFDAIVVKYNFTHPIGYYLIIEENHFDNHEKHGTCHRYVYQYKHLNESKEYAFSIYTSICYSHGKLIDGDGRSSRVWPDIYLCWVLETR